MTVHEYVMHQPQLPTLNYHIENYPCRRVSVVLVTHLLETAVPFVDALGKAVDLHAVVGIPYSTRRTAAERLSARHPVFLPGSLPEVRDLALKQIDAVLARNDGSRLVLQDIGGYFAADIATLANNPRFVGVVEDTNQGHWRYLDHSPLPIPVLSIAQSPLKALENRQVGRSIVYSLNRLLRANFYRLASEVTIGVIGYGGIGQAVARSLMAEGSQVLVYDSDPIRCARAMIDGHLVESREEVIRSAEVIIGVTGKRSITSDDFSLMRPGAIICSGSSKQVEIDVEYLYGRPLARHNESVTEVQVEGRSLYLLNDGQPINFLDQSILGRVLDLVYTELYMCIRALAEGDHQPGLAMLDSAIQRSIADVWCSWRTTAASA